jgi:uncharacterized OB-fold protein
MTSPLPRPAPEGESAAFWQHLRDGVLHVQACGDCGALRHPPRPRCPHCSSAERSWVATSGSGVLWSFTVCHQPVLPAFAERVPYVAAVVRLSEGPFLVTELVEIAGSGIEVGMPVELVVVAVDADYARPLFRPSRGANSVAAS